MLAVRGVEFPYMHDLAALLELCDEHGIDAPRDLSEVDRLSPFAVRLRYGAAHTAALDRDRALRWAAVAVKWAQGQVNPETPTASESERKVDPAVAYGLAIHGGPRQTSISRFGAPPGFQSRRSRLRHHP